MDTAEVYFRFEVEDDANRDSIAQMIKEQLGSLEMVQEADATPTETKLSGAEIVAGITVTIVVIRGGRELVGELRKLVEEITNLVKATTGLIRASVELGDEFVEVANKDVSTQKLSQEQLEKLAQEE